MHSVYVASLERYSGKTILTLILAYLLKRRGKTCIPFKPFTIVEPREGKPIDESIVAICNFLEVEEPVERLCPIVLRSQYWYTEEVRKYSKEELLNKVLSNYNELSKKYDTVLIIGYKSIFHKILGKVSEIELAKELKSKLLLVVKPTHEDVIGDVLAALDHAKAHNVDVIGVVFNMVRHHMLEKVRTDWVSILDDYQVDVLGVIPEIAELHNPTIRELVRELDAKVLTCEDMLDMTFESILIGAMAPETALKYMRAASGKIVITGGDRADLILAALETDTRAIILTGGVYPSVRILAKAEERKVPILLVNYDTFTTVSKILSISGKLKPGDRRLSIVIDKVLNYVNIGKIIERLGA